jgi:hypothetical protein
MGFVDAADCGVRIMGNMSPRAFFRGSQVEGDPDGIRHWPRRRPTLPRVTFLCYFFARGPRRRTCTAAQGLALVLTIGAFRPATTARR